MSLGYLRQMRERRNNDLHSNLTVNKGNNMDTLVDNKTENIQVRIKNRNNWLSVLVIGLLAIVTSIKMLTSEFTMDIPTLLTFLLSFFSIIISAIFYFKATEQSNAFYDRSFIHTKEIAEALSAMRGEFGKSLAMLEQSSNDMRTKFDDLPTRIAENAIYIRNSQSELTKALSEMETDIELTDDKKEQLQKIVQDQQKQLDLLITEIQNINTIKKVDYYNDNYSNAPNVTDRIQIGYYKENFLEPFAKYLPSSQNLNKNELNKYFHQFRKSNKIPNLMYQELKMNEYIDISGNLTDKGYDLFIRYLYGRI
ncbi:hypothetical protein [Neobacillus sp. FSL H8-0543]|uniref:hypothetical protein n=1 Tax=Neobacillus sp. FSL H8-0543 TaxID=2954672 RepID=UPI0031598D73